MSPSEGQVHASGIVLQTRAANPGPPTFIHKYAFSTGPDTSLLTFPLSKLIQADDQAWSTDIEFAREMLSGINPLVVKLLTEFLIKSMLDPPQFGNPLCVIMAKDIEEGLLGFDG